MTKIFVFGSNLAGIHGAGAAATAVREYGAVYGLGEGIQGRAYAIPTKRTPMESLPLVTVATYVQAFLQYAKEHPECEFWVTRIGCGLAGFKDEEIAPLFVGASANVILPKMWGGNGYDC